MTNDRTDPPLAAYAFLLGLALAACAVAYLLWHPAPPPPTPRQPTKPLSARDAGKAVGHTAHQFGKGIIEGWCDAKEGK